MDDFLRIRGARTHNLKNINLDLPRNKLIVFTGLSGSGKSSLAFDTLYAEGQRRYVESLSAYARQFLSLMEKPDVDQISGLSPAIAIEQKSTSHNPRSTVGTVTEIHDYLRLLFARIGTPHCPEHGEPLAAQTISQMVDQILAQPAGSAWMLLAPVVSGRKGEYQQLLSELNAQGFIRARIDGELYELDAPPKLAAKRQHRIEVVVDRFRVRDDLHTRLAESLETALHLSAGFVRVASMDSSSHELTFSASFACPHCGYNLAELEPRLFSFNHPAGACARCDGLGVERFFDPAKVVVDPAQSLAAGAVYGGMRRKELTNAQVQRLAAALDFDPNTPWQALPESAQQALLYGMAAEQFEGLIPALERRYRETESMTVREELARYLSDQPCPDCNGTRLNPAARNVFIAGHSLPQLAALSLADCLQWLTNLTLHGQQATIGERIVREIIDRLQFLVAVGLDYLSLERSAETLSGGEAQRIRLASQIGAGLVGVLYILDEPSIGLHPRDNARLLATLEQLRDLGNTVIVVEHDEEAIRAADQVVDLGPGAGAHGGTVVAQGTAAEIAANPQSLTGRYLARTLQIAVPTTRTAVDLKHSLRLCGASGNNLQQVDALIPVGTLCVVTGVSGSGKSTLINDTLYPLVAQKLHQSTLRPAPYRAIEGLEHFDKVVAINQSPIGRTPRSNPATYTGLFTLIRELFAAVPESRARGYLPGRFSFNVKGGRCEACKGDGVIRVEMHFLPDLYVTCEHCHGRRYNRETLEIRYKGRTIDEVLGLSVDEAADFFAPVPTLKRQLDTLIAVGLGYIALGQRATTLSGGEAQRVKLSRELSRRATGRTLYLLDEPTTGLHFHDVHQLLTVLQQLRDQGNTIIVIEHNLDVIKTADWIIDLGPEGGQRGGQIIATGTPEQIAACAHSYTGQALTEYND